MLRALLLLMSIWFVDGLNGSDSNAGTSFAQAFKTIAKAASVYASGDQVNLCATTAYTITASVNWTNGAVTISGANASGVVDGTIASITTSTNNVTPLANTGTDHYWSLYYLNLSSSAVSPAACITGNGLAAVGVFAQSVSWNGFSTAINMPSTNDFVTLYGCEVAHCTGAGVAQGGGNNGNCVIDGCSIHNNGGVGLAFFSIGSYSFRDTQVYGNAGAGISLAGAYNRSVAFRGCTIAFNGGDGYNDQATTNQVVYTLENNVFYGNSGYGINSGSTTATIAFAARNAFGGNSAGSVNSNLPASVVAVTLASSPFVSSSNLTPANFGAALLPSFPGTFLDGTTSYRCIGAVQPANTAAPSTPNTPTLTVTDNGNGTGAVATILGSAAGSVNLVEVSPIGVNGALTQAAFGPRTGDGTVPLSLSNGAYIATVTSSLGGVYAAPCDPFEFTVSGGGVYSSVHKALAEAVASYVRTQLGTTIIGPSASSVRVRKVATTQGFTAQNPLPDEFALPFPAIIVCYHDKIEENPFDGVNDRDEIGYPITFAFERSLQGENLPSEYDDDTFLTWQEVINASFQHLRAFGGHFTVQARGNTYTFHDCVYRDGSTFDVNALTAKTIDRGFLRYSFILWRGGL